MRRLHSRPVIAMLPLLLVLLAPLGCKKPESECMKKCKKLLACYEETRGKVSDSSASLSHCETICQGKGAEADRKAVEGFGSVECGAWMRRHRDVADRAMKQGKGGSAGPARAADQTQSDYPFPKLQDRPPKDPKGQRAHRSPAQLRVDRIVISTATEKMRLEVVVSVHLRRPPKDIVDWPPAERDGHDLRPVNTVVNAFHCRALVLLSRLAAALGKAEDATRTRRWRC